MADDGTTLTRARIAAEDLWRFAEGKPQLPTAVPSKARPVEPLVLQPAQQTRAVGQRVTRAEAMLRFATQAPPGTFDQRAAYQTLPFLMDECRDLWDQLPVDARPIHYLLAA